MVVINNIVVKEMESDLERLKEIGNRFSKMGSETPLKKISLNELVDQQTQYLKKRRRSPPYKKHSKIENSDPHRDFKPFCL